jgi:hypothetical protein
MLQAIVDEAIQARRNAQFPKRSILSLIEAGFERRCRWRSEMHSCAFAPDGCTIVAGDGLGRVHFLRLVQDPTKPPIGETKIPLLLSPTTIRR